MALGAVWLASGFRPVRATSSGSPTASRSASDWAVARRSSQMIAGRSGSSCASSATSPSTWQARPSITTSSLATPARSRASRTAWQKASRQCAGSCSAHPPAGWLIEHGALAVASAVPTSSATTAFTLCEPTSTPITQGIRRPGLKVRRALRPASSWLGVAGEPVRTGGTGGLAGGRQARGGARKAPAVLRLGAPLDVDHGLFVGEQGAGLLELARAGRGEPERAGGGERDPGHDHPREPRVGLRRLLDDLADEQRDHQRRAADRQDAVAQQVEAVLAQEVARRREVREHVDGKDAERQQESEVAVDVRAAGGA